MNFYLIAELILYMIFFKHAFLKTEKMKILHFEKRVICSSPFLKMKESIFSAFKKNLPPPKTRATPGLRGVGRISRLTCQHQTKNLLTGKVKQSRLHLHQHLKPKKCLLHLRNVFKKNYSTHFRHWIKFQLKIKFEKCFLLQRTNKTKNTYIRHCFKIFFRH